MGREERVGCYSIKIPSLLRHVFLPPEYTSVHFSNREVVVVLGIYGPGLLTYTILHVQKHIQFNNFTKYFYLLCISQTLEFSGNPKIILNIHKNYKFNLKYLLMCLPRKKCT